MTGWYFHLAGYHEPASQANCFVSPSTASEYSHEAKCLEIAEKFGTIGHFLWYRKSDVAHNAYGLQVVDCKLIWNHGDKRAYKGTTDWNALFLYAFSFLTE